MKNFLGIVECNHGATAPENRITSIYYGGDLQVEQAEPARHGCPVCAYTRGWNDAVKEMRINHLQKMCRKEV